MFVDIVCGILLASCLACMAVLFLTAFGWVLGLLGQLLMKVVEAVKASLVDAVEHDVRHDLNLREHRLTLDTLSDCQGGRRVNKGQWPFGNN